jgi:hypothetical protein
MKKIINKFMYVYLYLICSVSWADLAKPPTSDIAGSNGNWLDTLKPLIYMAIKYGSVASGALILFGTALIIFNAYQTAQEKQDLGHFFKHLLVGLLVAAVTSPLVYVAYTTVSD